PNVHLVNLAKTPIERVSARGIVTSNGEYPLDLIVMATGFDAITGAWDRIDITGVDGRSLADAWSDGPRTYYGLMAHGFPNLLMVAGPQSVSGSTNFPRAIEGGVDWITNFVAFVRERGITRFEATAAAEQEWIDEVVARQDRLLIRRSQGWYTGYNRNVDGHGEGTARYMAYWGGAPRYHSMIEQLAADEYPGLLFEHTE
ncbi:MAG: cyclohexanone monooxygenase, partial [Actinomycetota bacterium]